MDWIQGQKFEQVADFIYSPEVKARDDYDKVENTFDFVQMQNICLYTHTIYIKELFKILASVLYGSITLISHNSDVNIDETFEIPECVVKWYSTNVDYKHPKLESIPIGIENDRWMKKVDKKAIMVAQVKKDRRISNLVYMNHNISTNPLKRMNVYQMFENKHWVTSERGKNGMDFNHYVAQIYNHQFMICPEGNGMDTHRMWECLYLGTIPIVKRSINNSFYKDLPICFVDDWDEITKPFLFDEFFRIQKIMWNRDKLTQKYWNNKIKSSVL